jgi:hypothetical protein
MGRFAARLISLVSAVPLAAQPPPALLQIVQERLNPNAEAAYGKIEEELARLCTRMDSPNRYLALASLTLPREVWWLNMYASQTDVDRVAEGYARKTALTAAMRQLAQGKQGLTTDPIDIMTTFRPDLSDSSPWRIGELPFAVVLQTPMPAKAAGAVFQSPKGGSFVLVAAASRKDSDRMVSVFGRNARIFVVRPEWSRPYDKWVSLNPRLWRR